MYEGSVGIIMEFCEHGDLRTALDMEAVVWGPRYAKF